ncbi:MAG: mobile mystery protein B, partial [Raoultibacter sp.]
RDIHRRMFGDVWSWAGAYRTHDTSIGIFFERISVEVRNLLEDAKVRARYLNESDDAIELFAIWFHWRLVCIHPFPNGNGRQTRQMADLILASFEHPPFSWSDEALIREGSVRSDYIAALEYAGAYDTYGNLAPLLSFARR